MPNDEPATEDDSMGSEEQRSAQPAKPGEAPVDTEHSTSSPESSAPASSNGEVSPESAEKDKPDAESESTAQKESGHDETDSKPRTWSDDFGERMLALERPRDARPTSIPGLQLARLSPSGPSPSPRYTLVKRSTR